MDSKHKKFDGWKIILQSTQSSYRLIYKVLQMKTKIKSNN